LREKSVGLSRAGFGYFIIGLTIFAALRGEMAYSSQSLIILMHNTVVATVAAKGRSYDQYS
jgi:hypothetical protein